MHRTLLIVTALGISLVARSATGQVPASAAPPAGGCEVQLKDAQAQNATVGQLWRDINNQRVSYEIQVASIRAALGPECPESTSVSQCVVKLQERYFEAATKLAKSAPPAPEKAK